MNKILLMMCTGILGLTSCSTNNNKGEEKNKYDKLLLVGTYTAGTSKGISTYKFNTVTGESKFIGETEIDNPSYLAISNDEKYVYAVSESGVDNSKVSAFKLNKAIGKLDLINVQPTGADPCYISIDKSGRLVLVADYSGGSVSSFQVKEDGGLDAPTILKFVGSSINFDRQNQAHLHNVVFPNDERFLFANDLGSDKIYKFEVKETDNKLSLLPPVEKSIKTGSGPRHTVFHPNGKFAYTITELSGEVIVFDYDAANGDLKEIQKVIADTLNVEASGDIHITPNGNFLYASNRLKGDGLAIFSIDENTGLLTKIGYQETGIHPRNFVITPNGELLLVANRDSNNIQVFKIEENGLLTDLELNIEHSMPVCLKFATIN